MGKGEKAAGQVRGSQGDPHIAKAIANVLQMSWDIANVVKDIANVVKYIANGVKYIAHFMFHHRDVTDPHVAQAKVAEEVCSLGIDVLHAMGHHHERKRNALQRVDLGWVNSQVM